MVKQSDNFLLHVEQCGHESCIELPEEIHDEADGLVDHARLGLVSANARGVIREIGLDVARGRVGSGDEGEQGDQQDHETDEEKLRHFVGVRNFGNESRNEKKSPLENTRCTHWYERTTSVEMVIRAELFYEIVT